MQAAVTPTLVSLESLLSFLAGKILISTLPVTPSYKKKKQTNIAYRWFCFVFLNIILMMMIITTTFITIISATSLAVIPSTPLPLISRISSSTQRESWKSLNVKIRKKENWQVQSHYCSLYPIFLIKKIYFVLQTTKTKAKIVILIYYSLM